jgi:hypothetical protein
MYWYHESMDYFNLEFLDPDKVYFLMLFGDTSLSEQFYVL